MHLSLVLLALSTLAAAGPLPPFSETTLEARALPSTPANYTLGPDAVAALAKLKAVYDGLNEPNPSGAVKIKRDFLPSPDDNAFDFDLDAVLTKLKAIYDSRNEKRTEGDVIAKRDLLWDWFKDIFKAPGLGARSSVPTSAPDDNTIDSDPVAFLTHLKAVYDNLNEKRMEGGVKAKRDFAQWIKDMFEAPGLKARSSDDHSLSDSKSSDAVRTERTCAGVSGFKGPILPRGDSESQGGCSG